MNTKLINSICDVTCSEEELNGYIKLKTTDFDFDDPFKKYFKPEAIYKACNKYLDKEWSASSLGNWFYIYDKILCGDFKRNVDIDFNPLESLLKEIITWDIDGLSFFDDNYLDDGEKLDVSFFDTEYYVFKTASEWRGVYSPIGKYDLINKHQHVLLYNDKKKEYIIIFSEGFLSNNYRNQNDYLRYTTKKKFEALLNKLKKDNYSLVSFNEDNYYSDLVDE